VSTEDRLYEVVLARRAKPQPTPDLVQGGDCGACVYGGLFDLPIERVYDEFREKRTSLSLHEMSRMLRVAQSAGLADRVIDRPVHFRPHYIGGGLAVFGEPAWLSAHDWHKYVQAMIDAGYYGLAQVDFSRKGLDGHGADHWVLICGSRTGIKWSEREGVGRAGEYINDVLVSCSARSTGGKDEWVDAMELLKHRGGYNILFARPAVGRGA
jgi:hypothetical protein